ncbi:Apolipoprotein N-acyltransferase [Nocardiopsis dassonvillei]|uniref:nitrilase-related carbon-nitrogen hydrolase n=1 Tax=Nocardiopsis dassonvillei TaxID=2014 RepID=UPI003F560CC3
MSVDDTTVRRATLWAAGTLLSVFAMQAAWDIALLAWLFPVLLLRFTRSVRPLAAFGGALASTTVSTTAWLALADLLSPALLPLGLLLALFHTVPYAVDRLLYQRIGRWASAAFPAAVVAVEFGVASATPFGTIQGVLGATQAENTALIQLASVTGVYGVSFLVAWTASAAALVWERGAGDRPARNAVVAAVAAVAAVTVLGGARLVFTPPAADTVRVAGVSASRAAWEQIRPTFREYDSLEAILAADRAEMRSRFAAVNDDLLASTEREAEAGAEVVVWAESAAFTLEADRDLLVEDIARAARRHGIHVNAGMSVYTEEAPHLRNQMVLVGPDGSVLWTYDKSHPIPVLEPYEPGDGRVPVVDTPAGRLATVICYDGDFPGTVRQAGTAGADILLIGANTWEGIKEMHARNAVFRAVENGVSLVRQASRGRSNAVDPLGRTLATVDYYSTGRQILVADVPRAGTATVYARTGDVFAWLCAAALLPLAAGAAVHRRPGGRGVRPPRR